MGACLRLSPTDKQKAETDHIELNTIIPDSIIHNTQSKSYTISNKQISSTESDDFHAQMMQNLHQHKRSISKFKEQQINSSQEEIQPIKRNHSIDDPHIFRRTSSTADQMIQSRRRHKRTISKFKEQHFTNNDKNKSNHSYVTIQKHSITQLTLHKEGWIEVYNFNSDQWQKQWMVLNNEMLQFFIDPNKYNLPLNHFNLRQCTNISQYASTFSIYKNKKEVIKCRIIGNDLEEFKMWKINIQECIEMYGDVMDISISDKDENELKVKRIQNIANGKISLIIFDAMIINDDYDEGNFMIETPHDDKIKCNVVTHIYVDKNNVLRLENEQWDELKNVYKMFDDEYQINESLSTIKEWCTRYKTHAKECINVSFVEELSFFLNIPCMNEIEETENNMINTDLNEIGEHNGNDDKSVKDKQWSCSMCTFLNHSELLACEICQTPHTSNN